MLKQFVARLAAPKECIHEVPLHVVCHDCALAWAVEEHRAEARPFGWTFQGSAPRAIL